MTGYDIIGDVHGCASKLEGLLAELGYQLESGVYRHSERQAIFVGDLIDRGDEQVRTLEIVRSMVEAGTAQIVMGNHEFNAISYATPNPELPGEFMRPHNEKNRGQHEVFLEQARFGSNLHSQTIEWFKTLPLHLDLGDLRIVHACWNDESIQAVRRWMTDQPISTEFVIEANKKGTAEHRAIEVLLKGPEMDLRKYGQPDFRIPGDRVRHEARIRWWNATGLTLFDLAEIAPATTTADGDPYPELPNEVCGKDETEYDYDSPTPVFYGHYWRRWAPEQGQDWTRNTACVDFSAVRGGPLVAYRWDGEAEVDPSKYIGFPEMSSTPQKHMVFSRPPVEGTEDELNEWVDAFIDMVVAQPDQTTRYQEGMPQHDD